MENSVLQLFPLEYRAMWRQAASLQGRLQEIRLRTGQPVLLHTEGRELFLREDGSLVQDSRQAYRMDGKELAHIMEHICHYSPYAFEEEIRQGFLTVAGGHRIGVAGQAVLEKDGSVRTIKNISFLNIRIAHQIKGAADGVLPSLYGKSGLRNTLIISPPGCGKTTLLRDLIRQVSDGNSFWQGMTVGVVDERSELAGSFLGVPQNDMGIRTDVLDGCPKAVGMFLLLRSMAPEVLAIDELGNAEELAELERASACGCKVLATAHGDCVEEVALRFGKDREFLERRFERILLLGKPKGKCVVRQILEGGRKDA